MSNRQTALATNRHLTDPDVIENPYPFYESLHRGCPPHTRHRVLVNKALDPRRVRKLEGAMREIAHDLVDRFADDGQCELHTQFGIGLPLTVIADALGVEREDMPAFKRWSDCMLAGNIDVRDNTRRAEVARAVIEFRQYMIPRIEARREEPRDDLLSDLANAEIEDSEAPAPGPRRLTTAELLPIVSHLLLAGNETTTNLIGNGLVVLVERPDVMAEVRADHGLIPGFIEEVLRGDPRGFDVRQLNARRLHIFGAGPHFCAGAEMARVEVRVAFEVLLGRLDEIRLADGVELEHQSSSAARGYRAIPIEFQPIPRSQP